MNVQLTVGDVLRVKQWMRINGLRIGFLAAALGLGFTGYAVAASGEVTATQTALTVSTDNAGSRTKATLTAQVSSVNGSDVPAGVVNFRSGNSDLGSVVVNGEGKAALTTNNLTAGSHTVVALYEGDSSHSTSISPSSQVDAAAATVATFTIAAAPTSLNIAAGAFATSVVTITPVNGFDAYVSLSCGELPINTTCVFSPTNVPAACTTGAGGQTTCTPVVSTLQIQTLAPSGTQTPTTSAVRNPHGELRAYAFGLPVLFGLAGGLAGLGTKRRRGVSKVVLVVFLFAGMMAMTACREQYNYFNHGPTANAGTPAGTYAITINSVSTTGSLITTPATSPQLTLTVTN
jgi:Bacterial Ig-like domain (group 3)